MLTFKSRSKVSFVLKPKTRNCKKKGNASKIFDFYLNTKKMVGAKNKKIKNCRCQKCLTLLSFLWHLPKKKKAKEPFNHRGQNIIFVQCIFISILETLQDFLLALIEIKLFYFLFIGGVARCQVTCCGRFTPTTPSPTHTRNFSCVYFVPYFSEFSFVMLVHVRFSLTK